MVNSAGTRTDDRGHLAQLHGVGIQRIGERWYAWGEDKHRGDRFAGISCYSTDDFNEWRFEGCALSPSSGELAPDRIVERPKVLQRPDGAWVMFLHLDLADYSYAHVGYAIAERPEGPYAFAHSERPLGNQSRDIGVYQQGSRAYLLSEDRENGLHIYELSDDYLRVSSIVATLRQQDRPHLGYESPTLVKHEDVYYLFGSDLTGWSLNANKYCTSTSLSGPWTPWRDFAPPSTNTFESQVSVVVEDGRGGHVYVGDRWKVDDLLRSETVILPILLGSDEATLTWHDRWDFPTSG